MTIRVEIRGTDPLELDYLLIDVNGTLSNRGELLDGVADRLRTLAGMLDTLLLSADAFGTLDLVARELGVAAELAPSGADKLRVVERLGSGRCVAVGNGANDAEMLGHVALGIAVIGAEGASAATVARADIVCRSIVEALDLLADPRTIAATLRS